MVSGRERFECTSEVVVVAAASQRIVGFVWLGPSSILVAQLVSVVLKLVAEPEGREVAGDHSVTLLESPALPAVHFRTLLLPHVVNLVGLGREVPLKVGFDVVL